jgi:uncharacterized protein DUF5678
MSPVLANVVSIQPGQTVVPDGCTMYVALRSTAWRFVSVQSRPDDDLSRFERDRATFYERLPELAREYAGKYVAIYNGEIAAIGDSDTEAARRFYRDHPYADVYIGFVGEEPPAYQIRPSSR